MLSQTEHQATLKQPSDPSESIWKCSQFRVEPLNTSHFELLQGDKHPLYNKLLEAIREGVELTKMFEDSFTGMCDDQPVICAGFIKIWPGMANLWAAMDDRVTPNIFRSIHRHACKIIDAYQPKVFRRLEMQVPEGFPEKHHWAKMLGFEKICDRFENDNSGRTYTQYARIR